MLEEKVRTQKFIHDHHFQTKYGQEVLEAGNRENENKVKYILSFCAKF
jgi:uncharacterized protein